MSRPTFSVMQPHTPGVPPSTSGINYLYYFLSKQFNYVVIDSSTANSTQNTLSAMQPPVCIHIPSNIRCYISTSFFENKFKYIKHN